MNVDMLTSAITHIQTSISNVEFQNCYKLNRRYFTRSDCGVITFRHVMLFVLFHMKNTLGLAVIQFCKALEVPSFGASAITKARKKISWEAFYSLFTETASLIKPQKLYKGYQLIALDGSDMQLPNTPELHAKYSNEKTTSHVPQAHAVASYDVLNKTFLDAVFLPYPTNERAAALQIIKNMGPALENILFLFDRGFPSVQLIKHLNATGAGFVFRVSRSFLKEVNQFWLSNALDATVGINYTKERIRNSNLQNELTPFSFDLRMVKIVLPSSEIEVLITNKGSDEFTIEELYELYGLRWGIETGFRYAKHCIEIERFDSVLENSILQEFYASLILYNLSQLLIEEAQTEVVKKKAD